MEASSKEQFRPPLSKTALFIRHWRVDMRDCSAAPAHRQKYFLLANYMKEPSLDQEDKSRTKLNHVFLKGEVFPVVMSNILPYGRR